MFEITYWSDKKRSSEHFFDWSLMFAFYADDTLVNPTKWKEGAREHFLMYAEQYWRKFCDPVAHGYGPPVTVH